MLKVVGVVTGVVVAAGAALVAAIVLSELDSDYARTGPRPARHRDDVLFHAAGGMRGYED